MRIKDIFTKHGREDTISLELFVNGKRVLLTKTRTVGGDTCLHCGSLKPQEQVLDLFTDLPSPQDMIDPSERG